MRKDCCCCCLDVGGTSRARILRVVVSVLVFVSIAAETKTTTATNAMTQRQQQQQQHETNQNSIVSIPLIPHRLQRARRRLERLSSVNEDPNDEEFDELERLRRARKSDQPLHYHRWRHLAEGGDTEGGDLHPEQVAGLFQGYGTHYADLWCGTPPQRQTVIVDTGSGVTAFPCTGCNDCGVPDYHIDELFDGQSSSTFHQLSCSECLRGYCGGSAGTCDITMAYQEGSQWGAYEASDSCYVGGLHYKPVENDSSSTNDFDPFHAPSFAFDMKFGCQTRLTGLFRTQLADGIMGMDIADSSFWKQMYDAGKIGHQAFSLCFNRVDTVERTGTESGAMTLGGMDSRLHNSAIVYTGKSSGGGGGFFNVRMRNIYLRDSKGGVSAMSKDSSAKVESIGVSESDLNRGSFIVDSGTTDTYLSQSLSGPFKKVFKHLTGQDYTHSPMKLTDEQLDAYPTILFQLEGDEEMNKALLNGDEPVVGLAGAVDPDHPYDILVAMPPRHYFEYDDEDETYQARFYTDEGGGGVLGANTMMGHDVFFDVEHNRIGWAESPCDYTALVKKYGNADVLGPFDSTVDTAEGRNDIPKENDNDSDEPSDGSVVEQEMPANSFCKDIKCQMGMVIAAVVAVAIVAIQMLRRSGSTVATQYHLPGEIELQEESVGGAQSSRTLGATSSDDAEDGEFVTSYRDRMA